MFEFSTETQTATGSKRKQPPPWGKLWLSIFSATFAAVLLAGLVLGVGVRAYLHWSVSDAAKKIDTERKK